MSEIVYVGSHGQSGYSGAEEEKGILVSEEMYDKHKDNIEIVFEDVTFNELDGKHSEVDGELVVKEFNNLTDVLEYTKTVNLDYGLDYFSDMFGEVNDEEQFEEVEIDKLFKDITNNQKIVEDSQKNYQEVSFYLQNHQVKLVEDYVKTLKK